VSAPAAPRPNDPTFGTVVGGVTLPFSAMNAAGSVAAMGELRALARSRTGAVVLRTSTVHPFVHPQFRSLKNPGFDKLAPVVRELVAAAAPPVVASIAGGTIEEFAFLAHAFAEAGAAAVEAHLGEPWVEATLAPCEDAETLQRLATRLAAASAAPVWLRLPDRCALPYRILGAVLADSGVRAVVARNEFTGFEKLMLEMGTATLDVLALGGVEFGWDAVRALAKGAKAVQVGPTLGREGVDVFARLEREMRIARGPHPRG
jgi:dihydroorotate dehydrogenase